MTANTARTVVANGVRILIPAGVTDKRLAKALAAVDVKPLGSFGRFGVAVLTAGLVAIFFGVAGLISGSLAIRLGLFASADEAAEVLRNMLVVIAGITFLVAITRSNGLHEEAAAESMEKLRALALDYYERGLLHEAPAGSEPVDAVSVTAPLAPPARKGFFRQLADLGLLALAVFVVWQLLEWVR